MKKFTDKINESVEDKIPTASEFIDRKYADFEALDKGDIWENIEELMLEFAKMHVKEALRVAVYSAEIEDCGNPYDDDDSKCISEKSIMESYPLENIK